MMEVDVKVKMQTKSEEKKKSLISPLVLFSAADVPPNVKKQLPIGMFFL